MSLISPSKKADMMVSISMISTGISLPVMLYLSCLSPSSVSLTMQCIIFPLGTMQAIIQSLPMNCFTVSLTGTGDLSVLISQSPWQQNIHYLCNASFWFYYLYCFRQRHCLINIECICTIRNFELLVYNLFYHWLETETRDNVKCCLLSYKLGEAGQHRQTQPTPHKMQH